MAILFILLIIIIIVYINQNKADKKWEPDKYIYSYLDAVHIMVSSGRNCDALKIVLVKENIGKKRIAYRYGLEAYIDGMGNHLLETFNIFKEESKTIYNNCEKQKDSIKHLVVSNEEKFISELKRIIDEGIKQSETIEGILTDRFFKTLLGKKDSKKSREIIGRPFYFRGDYEPCEAMDMVFEKDISISPDGKYMIYKTPLLYDGNLKNENTAIEKIKKIVKEKGLNLKIIKENRKSS